MSDAVAAVEQGFAAGTAQRLAALEVQAQDSAQRAADALARGDHDYGVMLLVCALITTEQIDQLESKGTS